MKLTRRFAELDDVELLFEINCAALKEHVRDNFGSWDEQVQRRSFWLSTDPASHQLFYSGCQPVGFWSLTRDDIEFAFLADRPELVPTVAQWWFDEWPRPGACLQDVVQRVSADVHTDTLPVQIVALVAGSVAGSAVLKPHEHRERYPELEHWLGNVFVAKAFRGQGIASALCARVIDLSLELGLPALHLQTQDVSGGLYARLGWQTIDRTISEGRDTLIMKKELPSRRG